MDPLIGLFGVDDCDKDGMPQSLPPEVRTDYFVNFSFVMTAVNSLGQLAF